jgi:hypothetical protein
MLNGLNQSSTVSNGVPIKANNLGLFPPKELIKLNKPIQALDELKQTNTTSTIEKPTPLTVDELLKKEINQLKDITSQADKVMKEEEKRNKTEIMTSFLGVSNLTYTDTQTENKQEFEEKLQYLIAKLNTLYRIFFK